MNGSPRAARVHPSDKVAADLIDARLEAEIIGSCLIRPHLLLDADVTESDFASDAHRTIWRAMLQLHADGEALDTPCLRSYLLDRGVLEQVGGLEYLLTLTDTVIPTPPLPTGRLKRLSILRRTRRFAELLAAHAADHEAVLRYSREIEKARGEYEALDKKSGELERHRFDALWKTVAERGALTTRPAPRRWLLQRRDDDTNGMANPIGVLPMGKCGLLIAQGGAGKTMALIQLAIAVATGRPWFDHYIVGTTGRVLLALAEEDDEEVDRRLYEVGLAMRLTDAQRAMVGERVVALGLAGHITALVAQDGQQTVETDVLSFFRRKLAEGNWTLVVLDTLARFAGGDTEKDNAQATRFIQTVESLCQTAGSPTVLIAHHTNKTSRTDGSKTSASHARGATALTDNTRWVGNLERVGDGVKFEITKTNYAPDAPAIVLVRDTERSGYLHVESADAARARAEEACREELERRAAVRARIVEVLTTYPDITNQGDLAVRCGIGKKTVGEALKDLVESGEVSKSGGVFQLKKGGGDAPKQ